MTPSPSCEPVAWQTRVRRAFCIACMGCALFALGFVLEGRRADALFSMGAHRIGPLEPIPGAAVDTPRVVEWNGRRERTLRFTTRRSPERVLAHYRDRLEGQLEDPRSITTLGRAGSARMLAFVDRDGQTCGVVAHPVADGGSRVHLFRSLESASTGSRELMRPLRDIDPDIAMRRGDATWLVYRTRDNPTDHGAELRRRFREVGFSSRGQLHRPATRPGESESFSLRRGEEEVLISLARSTTNETRVTILVRR